MRRIEILEVIGLILVVLSASACVFESSRVSESSMRRITGILEELRLRTFELELAIVSGDIQVDDEPGPWRFPFKLPENTIAESIRTHSDLTSQSYSNLRSLRSVSIWAFLVGSALVILGRCLSIRNRSNKSRHGRAFSPPCA